MYRPITTPEARDRAETATKVLLAIEIAFGALAFWSDAFERGTWQHFVVAFMLTAGFGAISALASTVVTRLAEAKEHRLTRWLVALSGAVLVLVAGGMTWHGLAWADQDLALPEQAIFHSIFPDADPLDAPADDHELDALMGAVAEHDEVSGTRLGRQFASQFESFGYAVLAADRVITLAGGVPADDLFPAATLDGAMAEVMRDAGAGLLVTHLFGPSLNPNSGDWSVGVAGYWFENGDIVHPVSEVTVAANLRDIYPELVAGSDLKDHDKANAPSLLVPKMSIGGR